MARLKLLPMSTVWKLIAVLVLLGPIALAGDVRAAEPKALGAFQDWTAFMATRGSEKICYARSTPKKEKGDYTKRGKTYVSVSHRPAEKVTGEVSVEAGYPYKAGTEVEFVVDGKVFKLFSKGENAWTYGPSDDRALIQAMRAGQKLVVRGRSSRGTLTTDTYSLLGFTAATNAINEACGVH